MKKALFAFVMVAALLAVTSCSKESLNEIGETNGVKESVVLPDEIEVSYDESMITKSFFGTDGLTPQWDETDSLFLKGSQPTIWYKFEKYPDASNRTRAMFKKATYGSFPGGMPTQIQAIYGLKEGTQSSTCTLPGTYNYEGKGIISNLPMQAQINVSDGVMDMSLKFYPVADILAVKVESGLVKKIRISADNMPFSGQVTTAILGSVPNQYGIMSMNDNTSRAGYEIVCNNGIGFQSDNTVFYFPIPSKRGAALQVKAKNFKVEIIGDGDVSKVMIAKQDLVFSKKDDATKKSQIYNVTFEENAVKLYGTTYWATKNVGASSKTDAGTYFVWGEKALAKFDDPVKHAMGEAWQTPSKADFQALIDSCDWVWDATNKGFKVISKGLTPKTEIFLPAGGYIDKEDNPTEDGAYCHYWSFAPNADADTYFLCVKTTSDLDKQVEHNPRYLSYNLRGVIHTGAPE